jgi:hypothetical protein
MDLIVAIDTRKFREMNLAVTFDTKGPDVVADQKESIRRSVGRVANVTSFELLYSMLKDPWASFLRMAFIADIRVKFVHFSQAGAVPASVGCMTVRAFQCPLDDPMILGEIKLGLDISMAGKTEIGLFCFQKILSDRGFMDLMAVITAHCTELMDSSAKLKQFLLPLMAFETVFRTILGILILKRENESLSFCLSMFFTWTVARLTTLFFVCQDFPVGICLFKSVVGLLVTPFTSLRTYISSLLHLLLLAK